MLDYKLLPSDGILEVHPRTPLLARDFAQLSEAVDRHLSHHGQLQGLLISADETPGWEDFSELVSHIEFIHEHHKMIPKVAAVSNAAIINLLVPISQHFSRAEVKQFDSQHVNEALDWISH